MGRERETHCLKKGSFFLGIVFKFLENKILIYYMAKMSSHLTTKQWSERSLSHSATTKSLANTGTEKNKNPHTGIYILVALVGL